MVAAGVRPLMLDGERLVKRLRTYPQIVREVS
ncbi:hypothetical protein SAMN05216204_1131 [Massilia yuzhufengensis]|uniref:Uncharacterized protein n=1 Tax=Massilia yuzhufengensis TaxID=1164594 RepID=A0A1I1N9P6_9BURK|nr:hypothetical protein SAMN05216204_1033 [Massilia yuzhufengensis]SFC23373.1 hypothetical protein SAMN05216204_104254 [Massilia yuzhufengensis]SFC94454.1 hypothetical protein SAMN05216204_1131 [Massilia yuzhufengensis]